MMDDRHREVLRMNQVFLVQELDLKSGAEEFFAYLMQSEIPVLTTTMKELIEVDPYGIQFNEIYDEYELHNYDQYKSYLNF